MNGLLSKTWATIQKTHYDSNKKDGENIHRWKRLVVKEFLELLGELWVTRCGYIHAEKTMTEHDMLSHRTLATFNKHKHQRDLISVLDRHLFDKKQTYFYKSTKETLELWELKVTIVLKNMKLRERGQNCISFPSPQQNVVNDNSHPCRNSSAPTIESRLQRLGEYITRAKMMKRRRRITNGDSVWNKRLRLMHKRITNSKRDPVRKHHTKKNKRVRYESIFTNEVAPKEPMNLFSHNSSSVRS